MIERNEVKSDMVPTLGHTVLKSKAQLSHDHENQMSDYGPMVDRMSEAEEKAAFIGRVKRARLARFPKQGPILTILGVDQGTYKQYESRTPLPHRYLPKFCAATGVSLDWLLTGEGKGPEAVDLPRAFAKRPTARKTSRAA